MVLQIVYDRVTDRSRGFGFVTMGSVEEANEAIRMFDVSEAGGRTVKVNFPEVPKGGEREVMSSRIRSSERSFVDSPMRGTSGGVSLLGVSEMLLRTSPVCYLRRLYLTGTREGLEGLGSFLSSLLRPCSLLSKP